MAASVTIPLSQALARTKAITFRPFNLTKWFVLGFSAWLASLGEGGANLNFNYNYNFPGGGARPAGPGGGPPGVKELLKPAWDWITSHLDLVITLGVLAVVVVLALGLLLTWIRSQATFIFLDNLAKNEAEIAGPWKSFRLLGNSLFWFSICLGLIALVCYAAVGGLGVVVAWPDLRAARFGGHAIAALLLGLILLPLMIVFGLIAWCTNNFVAPLMYLRQQPVLPAWREFHTVLLRGNIGSFVLFLLLQFAVRIAIDVISALAGCLTCCIGFLPYLGTVITLPLYVFDRCYSVYFLEQFGPEYCIFLEIVELAGGPPMGPLPSY